MTKPNSEPVAAQNLTRQGYAHYYPRYWDVKPGKPGAVRPLFPRYIFINILDHWYSIKGTYGISKILMNDDGPQTMPEAQIQRLQARHDANGLFRLLKPAKFNLGDQVRTEEGPLAGLLLLYDGMTSHDRVRCLWEVMGRQAVVEVSEKALIAA